MSKIEDIKERIEVYKLNEAELRRSLKEDLTKEKISYYTTRREMATLKRVIEDLEFIIN